ncbi:MAG: FkbM family methyltransferase [Burkholderiales bacterium]|nr:FkbM family methyltransferase [Burkholderiales bacterium]
MITDLHALPPGPIALYGFGAVGRFVFDAIQRDRSDLSITCIIDDGKAGEFHAGIPIYSVEQAIDRRSMFERILVAGLAWRTMTRKLDSLGFTKYEPIDLLRGPAPTDVVEVPLASGSMRLATPNQLSAIVAKRFFAIEPDTIRWIESFTVGSCFYDVGASNGLFALFGAITRDCVIVAFEPDALNFGLLSKNRLLNHDSLKRPFITLQVALSDRPGLVDLVSPDLPYEGAHGKFTGAEQRVGLVNRGVLYSQPCLAESLGALIERHDLPRPDYLKIDVDGAEFSVLDGARTLLEAGHVREVLIETEDRMESRLTRFMRGCGYKLQANHKIQEMVGGAVEGVSNYLYRHL